MIRYAVTILVLALAGTASADQRRPDPAAIALEKSLRGLTPGAPQRCLVRERFSEVHGVPDAVLYVGGRTRKYLNRVVGRCPGLARGDIVIVRSLRGDPCEGDQVQTREALNGRLSGSCALGPFIPYSKSGG